MGLCSDHEGMDLVGMVLTLNVEITEIGVAEDLDCFIICQRRHASSLATVWIWCKAP